MDDYIKIREFAALYGVSRQAVYQRIKKDLAPYTRKVDGETLINTSADAFFAPANTPDNPVKQPEDKQPHPVQTSHADQLIDNLKEQISAKNAQITALQAQITQLLKINQDQFTQFNSQADKLREQIKNQSDHIMQQSERLSLLLSQQQYLTHAIAADPAPESNDQPPLEQQAEDTTVIETVDPAKASLWRRLFHK